MTRNAERIPSYRHHKATGQAVVTLNGKDRYLGPHGTAASRREYKRLIAEWAAGNGTLADRHDLTVAELIQHYRRHAEQYYRGADGKQTCEVESTRKACRVVRSLYGDTLAKDFGPLALQAVRGVLIDKGYCRTSINRDIGRIKLMFKWGVSRELLPPSVFQGLSTVGGLRIGRSGVKESEPVKPVPQAFVDAVSWNGLNSVSRKGFLGHGGQDGCFQADEQAMGRFGRTAILDAAGETPDAATPPSLGYGFSVWSRRT